MWPYKIAPIFGSPWGVGCNLVIGQLDSLIGPGELLLVVSHLFAVLVLVLRVGFDKSK
jgi:hypothetical protein